MCNTNNKKRVTEIHKHRKGKGWVMRQMKGEQGRPQKNTDGRKANNRKRTRRTKA
jgi:hypothetical protein